MAGRAKVKLWQGDDLPPAAVPKKGGATVSPLGRSVPLEEAKPPGFVDDNSSASMSSGADNVANRPAVSVAERNGDAIEEKVPAVVESKNMLSAGLDRVSKAVDSVGDR